MNIKNVKNIKFKGEFVLKNIDKIRNHYRFSSTGKMLVALAERDGLQCKCCKRTDIHFTAIGGKLYMNTSTCPMTMDHNILKSLCGTNAESNQNLLCKECNTLRLNLFAEYDEFEYFYNECKNAGKDPHTEINEVKRNFTYIDLERNDFNKSELKYVYSFISHKLGFNAELKDKLIKCFEHHNNLVHKTIKNEIPHMRVISSEGWDVFIDELMPVLFKMRLNVDIGEVQKTRNLFRTTRSKRTEEVLLNSLNTAIKNEYQALKVQYGLDKPKPKVQEVPVPVEVEVETKTFFSLITSVLKKIQIF